MRDRSGALVGRVDILNDVTRARSALTEARRLAEERAELLEREERRAQEEMALSRAAHMMASALTPADVHEHLLDQASALAAACTKSAVLALQPDGTLLAMATRGFSEESVKRMGDVADGGVVRRVMSGRRPFICNDTEADDRISTRIIGPEGIRSFLDLPIVLGERAYGVLSLNATEPRAFAERELRVLTELTRHAASALQNAIQFQQERHIAETLQQALIADDLPSVAGLELAALYQAAAGSQVGGDFYNAWILPDGRLALLVGDVSGKGVEAAGVTAMVRHMTEALSQHRDEPGLLVSELNDLLCPRHGRRNPRDPGARLHLARTPASCAGAGAGHPPPLVIDERGTQRALEDPDPPCGAFPGYALPRPRDLVRGGRPAGALHRRHHRGAQRRDRAGRGGPQRGAARGHGRAAGPARPVGLRRRPRLVRRAPERRRGDRDREADPHPGAGPPSVL